jgi:alanine racemase
VVKADAYGLGLAKVAPALSDAGCTVFFAAHLAEGLALRQLLPKADIYLLHGLPAEAAAQTIEARLIPVLHNRSDIGAMAVLGRRIGRIPVGIQIDTGMTRLGLEPDEALSLTAGDCDGLEIKLVMSHLACGDEPQHPKNSAQRRAFATLLPKLFPGLPRPRASLAASHGIFLGPEYHFDIVRPGVALYGANPHPGHPNEMEEVACLKGKVLQIRDVDTPRTVGYGATHRLNGPARIATVSIGYADGYPRALSNRGFAYFGQMRAPVVGRVSMDLMTVDVTGLPAAAIVPGTFVDVIGGGIDTALDRVASLAGTVPHNILTGLGRRPERIYLGCAE